MPSALKFSHFGLASEAESRCLGTPSTVQPVNRAAGLSLSSHLSGHLFSFWEDLGDQKIYRSANNL